MGLIRYTTATEVDPDSVISPSDYHLDFNILDTRFTDSYLYWDFGAGYFDGDFVHRFRMTPVATGGTTPYCALWGLANTVDDFEGIDIAGGDYLAALLVYSGGYLLQLRICENGNVTLSPGGNVSISFGTEYYVTMERDDDAGANGTGQITMRVYTGNYYGESGASEVATRTVDCSAGEQNDFQFLYPLSTFNTGTAGRYLSADCYDLDIVGVDFDDESPAILMGCSF
jgi:hypothetical protein